MYVCGKRKRINVNPESNFVIVRKNASPQHAAQSHAARRRGATVCDPGPWRRELSEDTGWVLDVRWGAHRFQVKGFAARK
ncbi:hypothetical protein C8J98_102581 [Luteibacter sp. OK325]|jgi:hypothetical protein|nr:hypothetical protein C8J98_102581 [Luteibacter sp. OK325]